MSPRCFFLGLLTDKVPQGIGATDRLLQHHCSAGGVVRLNVQPPGQNLPQRRDVGRAVRGVRGGSAGESRRAGQVAEAVAAPGRRAQLGAGGSGEGGTGAGILHWCLEENEGGDEREKGGERESLTGLYTRRNHGDRLLTQSAGPQRYYGNKPPLPLSRQIFPSSTSYCCELGEGEKWSQAAEKQSLKKQKKSHMCESMINKRFIISAIITKTLMEEFLLLPTTFYMRKSFILT